MNFIQTTAIVLIGIMFFFAFQIEYVDRPEPEVFDLSEARASYNPDMYGVMSLGARRFCNKFPLNEDCLARQQ